MNYFIIYNGKSKRANKSFRPFGSRKAAREAIAKRFDFIAKQLGITAKRAARIYGQLLTIREVKK